MNNKIRKSENWFCKPVIALLLIIIMVLSLVPQETLAALVTSKTVTTQAQLNKALADKNITTITIKSSGSKKLTIPNKSYKTKSLVINGSKLTIDNNGIFKKITVTNANLISEYAIGNSYTINDSYVNLRVEKNSNVKTITFNKKDAKSNIRVEGILGRIILTKKASLTLKGNVSEKTLVQIRSAASGSSLTSHIPVNISTVSDLDISLNKGAENSTITLTNKKKSISVANNTKKKVKVILSDQELTIAAGKTWSHNKKAEVTPTPIPNEPTGQPEVTVTPVPATPTPALPTQTPNPTLPGTTPTPPGPTIYHKVSFDSLGGSTIEAITIASGKSLTSLPTPQKENSIFLGWYTDQGFLDRFNEDIPVTKELTLYAKYSVFEIEEQNLNDSYALTDQNPAISFALLSTKSSMSAADVKAGISLTRADGPEGADLDVTGSNGTYLVSAKDGFTEGASYSLILEDSSLSFSSKEDAIRKCSFTIAKAEVFNIELNDDIIYIPGRDITNITKNGHSVNTLSVAALEINQNETGSPSTVGTFTYNGETALKVGDVLCIYSGNMPIAPKGNTGDADYLDDDIAYVKVDKVVTEIGKQHINYTNAEPEDVLFIPDVLPLAIDENGYLIDYVAATSERAGSFTAAITDLDFSYFSSMGLTENTTVDMGDFLALYSGNLEDGTNLSVTYGQVTSINVDNDNLVITFALTTEKAMKDYIDFYSKNEVDPAGVLSGINVDSLEIDIAQQLNDSGFAEDASVYLTALVLETDGFKEAAGHDFNLESFSVRMADGSNASLNEIRLLASAPKSKKVEIKNKKVKADVGTSLTQFSGNGVRCKVTVSFDIYIKTAGNDSIIISLSANFVEEVRITINTSANTIWDTYLFIPYIEDYSVKAEIDVYNYTEVSFNAMVRTQDRGSKDISKEIQAILASTNSDQISTGVSELFKLYQEMMENSTDWVEIFNQNICTITQSLLWGAIQARVGIEFVVSADMNVALGCDFKYKSGTRYSFWVMVKDKKAGSNTTDLMDEVYSFQFYVIGSLGLRAGIRLSFDVGIVSVDLNSIGLSAEAGIYTRVYGYFYYRIESVNNIKKSNKSGALFMELGVYLDIKFKAQALNGKYMYNPTLYADEFALIKAGSRYCVADFAYDSTINTIRLKDKVRTYKLPDSVFSMSYLDVKEGDINSKNYKYNDFSITLSDPNFTISGNALHVSVPVGVRKLECDMTVTWRNSPIPFSSMPMTRTFHVTWDDINDDGYTISFDSNGGSMVDGITQQYATVVKAPADPVKTGYTFSGWYSNESLTSQYAFDTMPAENLLLYTKWTPNADTMYKVEHYQQNLLNNDYSLYETEMLTGTTDTKANAIVKTYRGFQYISDAPETLTTGIIEPDGSLTLKLYYNRNSYKLTFRLDNGSANIVSDLKYNETIYPPQAVKVGHSFSGWDRTVDLTMMDYPLTYTAQWSRNIYHIEFDSNGGSPVGKLSDNYGNIINKPKDPTKIGYVFSGWYIDSSLTKVFTFKSMPAENIILYAKWDIDKYIPYKVEHYQQNTLDDGYTLFETVKLIGPFDTIANAKSKNYEGFTHNSEAEGTITSGAIAGDGSLILKLYYDRNSYIITLITDEGSEMDLITKRFGTEVSEPEPETKAGYSFEGWYREKAFKTRYSFNTMPAKNLTLYAKYSPLTDIPYKVEHYQQNAENDEYTLYETENLTGTCDTTAAAIGKNYDSYSVNIAFEDTVANGQIIADGSLTLKLYYIRNTYSVSFISNGGSSVAALSQIYGRAITAPETPTKLGYHFIGWCSDVELTNMYIFDTMPAQDITVYAKWEPDTNIPYKVDLYHQNTRSEGYTLYETEKLTGTCDTTATAVLKIYEGFTINLAAEGTVSSGTIAADGSLILKLYYDRNTYSINFNSNGGSEVVPISTVYGETVLAPESPVRLGYVFSGWYSDEALTNEYTFDTMPLYGGTLHAKWNPDPNTGYHVEHYQQNLENEDYSLIESDALTGTFNTTVYAEAKNYEGFSVNSFAPGAVSEGIIAADGSLTLKLYYVRNSYTITFNSKGGSPVTPISQSFDRSITEPSHPELEGHIFGGWYLDEELSEEFIFESMPAQDITLHAKWNINTNIQYVIEHYLQNSDDNGYTLYHSEELRGTFNEIVTATEMTYVGYHFNNKAEGTLVSATLSAGGTLKLKLFYDRNLHTISFISNGGSEVVALSQRHGSTVTEPGAPVLLGHIFSGWYTDEELTDKYEFTTMPMEDIVLYADWEVDANIEYIVEHYQQNADNDDYVLYEIDNLAGTFDTTATASEKAYEGFTLDDMAPDTRLSGTVTADVKLVLRMYYNRNQSTISFDTNGGSELSSIIQKQGSIVTKPEVPSRLGYVFSDWFSDEEFNNSYIFARMPIQNTTLYAKWVPDPNVEYRIEHYLQNLEDDGYTLNTTDDLTGTFDTLATAEGKSYEGFIMNSDVPETVASGTIVADGSLTLKLYYDRQTYTISYVTNGGSDIGTISQRYQSTTSEPTAPTRRGYEFVGWYRNETLTSDYIFGEPINGDIIIYAKWSPYTNISYKVEYYQENILDDGYSLLETQTLTGTFNTTVTATEKTYTGFAINKAHEAFISSDMLDENALDEVLTLRLYYSRNSYTISFNTKSNNEITIEPITKKYGFTVVAPIVPSREGYDFSGWYNDFYLTNQYTFGTMPAKNITIYAKWDPYKDVPYTVEYYLRDLADENYNLTDTVTKYADYGYVNYTIDKSYEGYYWNKDYIGTISSGQLRLDGSLTLQLYFDCNTYKITFNQDSGASATSPIEQKYGTTITEPPYPTKKDFDFLGWYIDSGCTQLYVFDTMPMMNITLYSKWERALYPVWVAGTQVSKDNLNHIGGPGISGNVYYNPTTNTLTLDNATITDGGVHSSGDFTGIHALYDTSVPLTIKVIGVNTITMPDTSQYCNAGLYSEAYIIIEGDKSAELTITAGNASGVSYGMFLYRNWGEFKITGGVKVVAQSFSSARWTAAGCKVIGSDLKIENGSTLELYVSETAVVDQSYGFISSNKLIINSGGKVIAVGRDAAIYGTLIGAPTVYAGVSYDGSDKEIYSGDTGSDYGWCNGYKYVEAIAQ